MCRFSSTSDAAIICTCAAADADADTPFRMFPFAAPGTADAADAASAAADMDDGRLSKPSGSRATTGAAAAGTANCCGSAGGGDATANKRPYNSTPLQHKF